MADRQAMQHGLARQCVAKHSLRPFLAAARTVPQVHRGLLTPHAYTDLREPPYTTTGAPTSSVRDYLKNPFDFAAFGPRLALGALLSSQETARTLQRDLEDLSILLQDPRPPQDKQLVLQKELEARLTTFLQRGTAVEAELLTALTSLLPADAQRQLPQEARGVLLRGSTNKRVPPTPPTVEEASTVPIETVAKNQSAAELLELRAAVAALRQSLTELSANTDPAQTGVLQVNVVDARTGVSRQLQQLSQAARTTPGAPIQAALNEANILLREVDRLRL